MFYYFIYCISFSTTGCPTLKQHVMYTDCCVSPVDNISTGKLRTSELLRRQINNERRYNVYKIRGFNVLRGTNRRTALNKKITTIYILHASRELS